jgi:uncharacterized protein YndB with AHSA1/START domain
MKWLLIILGVVVVLVLLMYVLGALMPVKHTASRAARFKQKPETVFAAITDWRAFPAWRPEVREVRERGGGVGGARWVEVSRDGEIPIEVIASDPPRRLVGRITDDDRKLPFGGTWTYDIEPAADGHGCTLTITEDGEVYPPPFRFMSKYVFGHTSTMERYLKNLGRKFGEEPQFIEK